MPASEDDGHFYQFRWGLYTQFIQDDMMDVRKNRAKVHKTPINTVLGEVLLDLWNRVELHAGVGTAKMEAQLNTSTIYSSGTFRNNLLDLNFSTALAWDVGINAKVFEWGNWFTGLGYSYYGYKTELEYLVDTFNATTHYIHTDADYRSWSLNIGGGYRAQITDSFSFEPHIVAMYGLTTMDIDRRLVNLANTTTVEVSELYTPYMWGYVLGLTLVSGNNFSLTTQLGMLMYSGFTVSGTIPF